VANQLQAFARQKGLSRFRLPAVKARKKLMETPTTEAESLLLGSRFLVFDELTRQITAVEAELEKRAEKEERIALLRTHPGVGPLTSLALCHTLGDVRRFRRKEEVVAFVGLDPLEKSSGAKKRIGSISKHGSRLVRHLLGQAAQTCRDKKIRQFYSQVSRRRGRPKAKVAAARKLLINCYVMLRDGISYEEFHRRGEVGLCEGSGEVNGKPSVSGGLMARPAILDKDQE
jgi:transposase